MPDEPDREWCLLEWIFLVGTIGGCVLSIVHALLVIT